MVLIKIICIFPRLSVEKRDRLWEGKVVLDGILSGIVLNVDTHGKGGMRINRQFLQGSLCSCGQLSSEQELYIKNTIKCCN